MGVLTSKINRIAFCIFCFWAFFCSQFYFGVDPENRELYRDLSESLTFFGIGVYAMILKFSHDTAFVSTLLLIEVVDDLLLIFDIDMTHLATLQTGLLLTYTLYYVFKKLKSYVKC